MLPLRHTLQLGALALLPLAAPAASIPVASGSICFDTDEPNPTVFPNGFIAYDYLCDFSLQVGANPGSGGFNSLIGQGGNLLSFEMGGLELIDFSPEDSTGPIHLEYGGFGGWSMLWREITDPENPHYGDYEALLLGGLISLRFEADSYPPMDGTHQMRVFAHLTLSMDSSDGDPLAEAFLAELMALTDDTGSLYLNTTATLNADGSFTIGAAELSTVIPEPTTVAAALSAAALGLCAVRRRLRNRSRQQQAR